MATDAATGFGATGHLGDSVGAGATGGEKNGGRPLTPVIEGQSLGLRGRVGWETSRVLE